jgi:chromosomal replication initiation ATPase DnaA
MKARNRTPVFAGPPVGAPGTEQLTFDLPRRIGFSRSDFLVSDSNTLAIGWIERWPDWPSRCLALYGPTGCGKTHLLNIWSAQTSGIVLSGEALSEEVVADLVLNRRCRVAIDDADRAPEPELLHLYNCCLEIRGSVLLAARRPPAGWPVALPDLNSRLRAILAVGVEGPDDPLLAAVLVKHFGDRQLHVTPEVISYLLTHMERSFAAAADIVDRLDAVSLRDQRAITVLVARQLVSEAQRQSSSLPSDAGVT